MQNATVVNQPAALATDPRDVEALNILAALPSLPAAVGSLSFLETVDLFKALGGGTASFDCKRFRILMLRAILAQWISKGTSAARVDALAQGILAARAARKSPALPAPPAAALDTLPAPPAAALEEGVITLPPLESPIAPAVLVNVPLEALPDHVVEALQATGAVPMPEDQGTAQDAPALPAALPMHDPAASVPIPGPAAPSEEILALAAASLETHPGITLPPDVLEALQARVPAAVALPTLPAGRAYVRDLFADCDPALVAALPERMHVPVFNHPDAPKAKSAQAFRFTAATLLPVLAAMASTPTMRVWAGGPKGTGKTEFARQLAARTGRAFYRINFNRHTEAAEVLGDVGIMVDGSTDFVNGPVLKALNESQTAGGAPDGSALILYDEPTYAAPGSLSALNPILERDGGAVRTARSGKAVSVHDYVFQMAADNTQGTGDASGEYHGRNEIGADTRDRFNLNMVFGYLPEAEEKALLASTVARECGIKPRNIVLNALMQIIKVAREQSTVGTLQGAPSFRGAAAFATLMAHGLEPIDAYRLTIINAAPVESHAKLEEIFTAHWPTDSNGNRVNFFGA